MMLPHYVTNEMLHYSIISLNNKVLWSLLVMGRFPWLTKYQGPIGDGLVFRTNKVAWGQLVMCWFSGLTKCHGACW